MITTQNTKPVVGLAAHFTAKNKSVMPKPNTLLAEMVRLTNAALPVGYTTDAAFQEHLDEHDIVPMLGCMMENTTAGTIDLPSEHTLFVDSVVNDVSKAVQAHIGFTKNVVKPVVLEVGKRIDAALAAFELPRPEETIKLKEFDVPYIAKSLMMMGDLNLYKGRVPSNPNVVVGTNDLSIPDILRVLLTGDQDTDEAIAAWYTTLDQSTVNDYWGTFFTANGMVVETTDLLFDKLNKGLFLFLACRRLLVDVSNAKEGQSLEAYKEKTAALRDYGGALITSSLSMIEAVEKVKRVILYKNQKTAEVHVYAPTYRQWLKEGGEVEAILGLSISNSEHTSHFALLENKDKLISAWKAHVSFSATFASNRRFDHFISTVRLVAETSMNEASQDEINNRPDGMDFVSVARDLLEAEIKQLRYNDMESPYNVALCVVCRSRFAHTSAEKILTGIEQAMKENPNLQPRDAALISAIIYVADYVADQMTLSA